MKNLKEIIYFRIVKINILYYHKYNCTNLYLMFPYLSLSFGTYDKSRNSYFYPNILWAIKTEATKVAKSAERPEKIEYLYLLIPILPKYKVNT